MPIKKALENFTLKIIFFLLQMREKYYLTKSTFFRFIYINRYSIKTSVTLLNYKILS